MNMSKAELFLQNEINYMLEESYMIYMETDNFKDSLSKEKLEEIKTIINDKLLYEMYSYVDRRIEDLYNEIKEDMKGDK